nr:PREDICTED: transcription initiation factor TFIID subunit 1-like [Bemisia tabaci]
MDDRDDSDDDSISNSKFNFTNFLFGNVDASGELEDDGFLDRESKRHLSSLGRFGLNTLLNEVISNDDLKLVDQSNGTVPISNGDAHGTVKLEVESLEDNDYDLKSPSAVDFSDFAEVAEDVSEPFDLRSINDCNGETTDYDADDEEVGLKVNCDLKPPTSSGENDGVIGTSDNEDNKKLETPLAAMLPSKYAGVDVRDLFPDFRFGKVLRFSRLFGVGKPSSLPQIWRNVKKRRKKKKKDDDGNQRYLSDSGSDSETRKPGWAFNYAPPPELDQVQSDDEDKLLRPDDDKSAPKTEENSENPDAGPRVADWRFGPAQVWYDMLDVPETGEGFNYGFKIKPKVSSPTENKAEPFPDDAFLMVSQLHWEDDVVWNGEDIKHQVIQKLNSKTNAAGWVPSSGNRTAQTFSQPGKGINPLNPLAGVGGVRLATSQMNSSATNKLAGKSQMSGKGGQKADDNGDDTWYSIFPVENEELIYGLWEDEIIWDAEAMSSIPKPKILTLDPNDENIILGVPNDVDPTKQRSDSATPVKVKIPHPHVKKSKILLGKAGVINVLEEDAPPPEPESADHDPFNVSNDSHYMPRSTETSLRMKVAGANLIQHSTPVVELRPPFVQTHMGPIRLRNFHRPPMKRFSHGALAHPGPHPVNPLVKHIKKKAKQREQERAASGGGDVFFMRTPEDLTGKDGELVLVEFCEEHPPLINQVGMCTKFKNYYKRKAGKDTGPPEFKYGETAFAHTSPFLGVLSPGKAIQAIENNMYRAPIYEHKLLYSDFLVIRTRHQYSIREVDAVFTAGQLCPLYEVPGPNSKRANNFVRDFLQVFIYRLFWKSRDIPKRIKMDDIRRAFPSHSESSIRKRLKLCADFKRTGMDSNWWVIKPDFRLPTEEEIRAMVSPEQCCAYFSMIAAEQRLKDAGYGEKFIFTPQDEDDEEMQLKMDDEVKVAPWNTTRAYIQAMKSKCLLQLTGPADPTGCGEGFSYVRIPNKPTQSKEEQEAQPKRTVTGTDADLRRLSLSNAKNLLRKFGVPEEEIKKLSRWEVIDVVRTLSTEKAKAGEEGMTKFSRGNRFSIAEHQERYKEECQRIFDLQNRVLSSCEVLSTDEGESTDEEDSSDIEEMGKNLENMLANKKTSTQLSLEKEEQERQELRKLIMGEGDAEARKNKDKRKDDEDSQSMSSFATSKQGRVLKIYRTFRNASGKEYTRMEVVRKPAVIDAYVKIRSTKDEAFIKQFATPDDAQKEEMKREKRRIQEQLRRIKRNQERERFPGSSTLGDGSPSSHSKNKHRSDKSGEPPRRKRPIKLKPDLKLKCGACGQVGHMRTNKACPLYSSNASTSNASVPMSADEPEEETEKEVMQEEEDLVNIDGTKVTLSGKLIKQTEELKRKSLVLKVPKDAMGLKKKRKGADELHCDYLKKQERPANRRRTDPVVVLSSILESILNEMRDLPDVQPFLFPVNGKVVPDYYKIVSTPMDLQTIRENLRKSRYQSREEFLSDVNQIIENSTLYNGAKSSLTVAAKRMLQLCVDRLSEKEERLMRLEKVINPLLDDDDQVALSYVFDNIVTTKLKARTGAWPFLKPVKKKLVPDYYNIVKNPIDLETISKKVNAHKYHSRQEFLHDIELILENCILYNGKDSSFTQQAEQLVSITKEALGSYGDNLSQLEANINKTRKRVLEQTDYDSLSQWQDEESYSHSSHHSKDFEFVSVGKPSSDLRKETGLLEKDLQFSSEEEEVEGQGINADDDSHQVAEAMMQLGNIAYFSNQGEPSVSGPSSGPQHIDEETMDVDPNYDPSDFLRARQNNQMEVQETPADDHRMDYYVDQDAESGRTSEAMRMKSEHIQDDLQVSESEDEAHHGNASPETQSTVVKQEEDMAGDLWF